MSNALPLSMSNLNAPVKAPPAPRSHWSVAPAAHTTTRPAERLLEEITLPTPIPLSTPERMMVARDRIRCAAEAGQRIRSYEVALDLDLSEFHFARQFRAAFGRSPHVYYDEVRAARARILLGSGMTESDVARRVGFRRPAELRALLTKRAENETR